MTVTVELQPEMHFLIQWVIMAAVLLAAGGIMLFWAVPREESWRGPDRKPAPRSRKRELTEEMRREYMEEISRVEQAFLSGESDQRTTYLTLSELLRRFAEEVTGEPVTQLTLTEIGKLRLPALENLVREYYEPEFALSSKAATRRSIRRTREVIAEWK